MHNITGFTHPMEITLQGAGLTLRADVAGPDSGAPVVLLHGGGQTRGAWGKTVSTLAARGFRAYAVDMRGHGESDWAEGGDYRIESFCDDLRSIVPPSRPPCLPGRCIPRWNSCHAGRRRKRRHSTRSVWCWLMSRPICCLRGGGGYPGIHAFHRCGIRQHRGRG